MTVLDAFMLKGKRALVTGGNRGLGLAFVRGLAEAGADVVFVSRDAERNAAAVAALAQEGLTTSAFEVDVTASDGPDAAIDGALDRLGGLDLLLNNAGLAIHKPALEITDEEWDRVFDVNTRSLWRLSRSAGAHMRDHGRGNILNVGSISSLIVNRPQWQPSYNASKAAVHQLTKSLAAEWAPYGIRVNAIAPGYVKTEMAPVDEPRFRRHWIEDAPMKRYALPEEIAPTVVYMASDASAFMTGSVVVIDGGYTLY
ncbi:short-chain dehydrogenase [Mycolicibacterium madagascariense]|uniref:Short-chain dehydrogenase n=1 Tax=Mycolicibacterium madagascariense TaxID=212765 RepID=A0A7I7XEN1_9MYCO|nr:SDR family oxidoreductase [Mycolicibacterium madagascariense]MCV7015345.1 SDR family oxidoreductase [Mycolicibacterium madagascariense]BBZ27641.1 short-chain dehydrogenase [Mycolicibacterium madagascariense]